MKSLLVAIGSALAVLTGCGNATPTTFANVTSAEVSDPDVIVIVKGWQSSELVRILEKFEQKYELSGGTLRLSEARDGASKIVFSRPMRADYVLFLINYLHYPEDFDLARRSPVALAVARLSPALGITEPPLLGRTATFYVPENDRRYDEVYAAVDDGSAFRVSFTNLGWEAVADTRQPSAVAALQKLAPPLQGKVR